MQNLLCNPKHAYFFFGLKTWRRQGIRIVQYLDDGIGAASGGTVRATAQLVKASLQAAGFVINMEKSVWEPTQLVTWLGIVINTRSFTIKITQKRIEKITKKMQHLLTKKTDHIGLPFTLGPQ